MDIDHLLEKVREYNIEEETKVLSAYNLARNLHKGQYRQSGEEYIIHPLNVACILADMHADGDTLAAGLLHDTLEDTDITKEELAEVFNNDVANLVDGVTKISKMNFSSKTEQNLANTRKIITGITDDVRVIIIKLADRLHNMRTLEYKSEFKQKENSLETMEIFVPLAYYIGAYRIKSELEDLSLKFLQPDIYKKLEEKKLNIELDNNDTLLEMSNVIKNILNDNNIPNEIKIRTKNIYGIYKRITAGGKVSQIHDLLALKIMVENVQQCYTSLGLIHSKYRPVNDKFKDYICNPKTNMYQSLHSTVFGTNKKLVQTQIRTFDMDNVASFGLSTYWDINRGYARVVMQKALKEKYQFFKSLKEIDNMFDDNKDFVSQVKQELFSQNIYVYAANGNVIQLPKDSTVIDFAYRINPKKALKMDKAIVNSKEVPLDTILKNKDRVIINVNEDIISSNEEWESTVKTTYAKRKIKEFTLK